MGGLFGGGGGSSAPVIQPVQTQQGNFQIYQPQAQQQADYGFQGLAIGPGSPLLNQAWSGLKALPGGVSPATTIYPQYSNIAAQTAADQGFGAYGSYGLDALNAAGYARNDVPSLANPAFQNFINFQNLGSQAAQNVYGNAFSPNYGNIYQNLSYNPYLNQLFQGASQGADIGTGAAYDASTQIGNVAANAVGLTGAGQQAAGQTAGAIPELAALLGGQGNLAGYLSGQAQGLNPQLQALYGSSVPGLQQLAGGLPGQLAQTAGQGLNLFNSLAGQEQALGSGAMQNAGLTQQQGMGLFNSLANQYQGLAQGAMGQTAQDYGQLQGLYGQSVPQMQQIAGGVGGIPQLQQGAQQIMQTGMDPQSQLFNKLQQQTADQSAVANAMSGLGSSPYGAGLTAENLSNFDINWQNQQLQRQAQALGAAGTAYGQAAGLGQTQANILGQAAQTGQGLTAEQLAAQQFGANTQMGAYGQIGALGQNQIAQELQAQQLANQTQQGALSQIGALGQNYLGLQQAGQLGGAQAAGNLLQGAANVGQGLTAQQLANLTGAGNIYNQQAQGAGALGSTIGGLSTAQLQQLLSGQQGTSGQLQAALGLGGGASQLAAQASAIPGQAYTQQQQTLLNALNQQNQAGATGAAGLSALTGQQAQALQGGLAALQGQAQMMGLPYQTAQMQQANAMAALQNQLNVGNNIYQLPQQLLNDLQSYMQLGQSASAYGGQLGQQAFNQNQQQLAGLGSLLNTGLGGGSLGGLLYGSQGLGGALGLGSGGLIGSLPGSAGFATAADFAGGEAGAGSGILGLIGSLLP